MSVAGKIHKDYNTPAQLRELTDVKLTAAGINEKNLRQLVISALRKAGYTLTHVSLKRKSESSDQSSASGASTLPSVTISVKISFGETLDEEVYVIFRFKDEYTSDGIETLETKSVITNRAPVMMPMSIAAVYTEMNAISKEVSLGIYDQGKDKGLDAEKKGSQPYVDLMGRRPLFKTQTDQWRAMISTTPTPPSQAFSYISRSFRQATPYVTGVLKLLAESYSTEDLNNKAWELYAQFRPSTESWGKKAKMRCSMVLNLRKE
ncbi:hypothetical protein AX15_007658 [Amanita polypyramis BW_CC]|nr:hypothetical protein AX15_007658 [Amanita polypyramis BW_CC]